MEGFSGIASGVNTAQVVQQLMALERRGQARVRLSERQANTRETALKDLLTRLKTLKTAAADLRSTSLWADTQSVSSSDPAKLAVTRLGGTGPGAYAVEVQTLARAAQRTYAYTPDPGAATQITVDGVSVDLAAGATIDDAVQAINGSSTMPVYAAAVTDPATGARSLVLSKRTTGSTSFTASGATLTEDPAKAKPGQDLTYTVDGAAQPPSGSNTVENAIPGLKLTFAAHTTGPVTVTVGPPGPDTAAVKAKLKAFVDRYNEALDGIRGRLNETRPGAAASDSEKLKGLLRSDVALQSVLVRMRTEIMDPVAGNPAAYDALADLGISAGAPSGTAAVSKDAVAGRLVLDESKLDAALAADPTAVRRLLGGVTGVPGFAQELEAALDPFTALDGTFDAKIKAAQGDAARARERVSDMDRRLAQKEVRLKAQFAAMETALGRSQTQGDWLAGQLSALFR